MRKDVLLFLSLIVAGVMHQSMKAQDRRPITLSESDASPAAQAVNSLIQKGATQDQAGDYRSAIETFELALQRLRFIPEMKRDEDGLLVRLGQSYIGARRLDDAVRTFRLLLDTQTETCRKNIAAVEYCAHAQYYISFADMQSNHALGRHDGNAAHRRTRCHLRSHRLADPNATGPEQ